MNYSSKNKTKNPAIKETTEDSNGILVCPRIQVKRRREEEFSIYSAICFRSDLASQFLICAKSMMREAFNG